jgi:hypothetical protein
MAKSAGSESSSKQGADDEDQDEREGRLRGQLESPALIQM